ncbi:MAG: hypothetical protein AABZ14_07845 [Candidatus Margulisiibacteriota bacterium]
MDFKKIEEIVRLFEKSSIRKLTVADKSLSVMLYKGDVAPNPKPIEPVVSEKVVVPLVESQETDSLIRSGSVGFFRHKVSVDDVRAQAILKKGNPLFSITSMNLDHAQTADDDCVVLEYLVADGVPVEYGQPVVRISPA